MQNCNTVRKRCLTYLSELRRMGIENAIPLANAKKLFSRILDLWDPETIANYLGTVPTVKTQYIQQRKRYQSGTVSVNTIELKHEVKHKEGYMERMGLISVVHSTDGWYMKIHNTVLIPQLVKISHESIENISLSPIQTEVIIPKGKAEAGKPFLEVSSAINELETTHNLLAEREITSSGKAKDGTLPIEVS
jgi:hypothetical protein